MFSVVTYSRVLVRAVANTITQGELGCIPAITSWPPRLISRFYSKQPAIDSAGKSYPCRLVTAVCGFSKMHTPRNHRPISKPAQSALLGNCLYGDDAYFVSTQNSADVLGVADGVGGWRHYGVDPSLFSQKLMESCKTLVESGMYDPSDPVELLSNGFDEMADNKAPLEGSSTACIVMLDRLKKTLHAANLGDSGFMVVRKGKVILRSEEQQHFFNSPFQLSIPPLHRRGEVHTDLPKDASVSSCEIELGDIIVTATDGLFDNMDENLILEELNNLQDYKLESLEVAVKRIAEQALELSHDPDYMSPFAQQAKENGYHVTGGKPDDITILLSLVAGT